MEAADPEAEGNMPAVGICPALLSPENGKPDDAEANADPSQDYNKKSPKAKTPMSTKHGERTLHNVHLLRRRGNRRSFIEVKGCTDENIDIKFKSNGSDSASDLDNTSFTIADNQKATVNALKKLTEMKPNETRHVRAIWTRDDRDKEMPRDSGFYKDDLDTQDEDACTDYDSDEDDLLNYPALQVGRCAAGYRPSESDDSDGSDEDELLNYCELREPRYYYGSYYYSSESDDSDDSEEGESLDYSELRERRYDGAYYLFDSDDGEGTDEDMPLDSGYHSDT